MTFARKYYKLIYVSCIKMLLYHNMLSQKHKEEIYKNKLRKRRSQAENMKGEKSLDKFVDFRHCYACVCVSLCNRVHYVYAPAFCNDIEQEHKYFYIHTIFVQCKYVVLCVSCTCDNSKRNYLLPTCSSIFIYGVHLYMYV